MVPVEGPSVRGGGYGNPVLGRQALKQAFGDQQVGGAQRVSLARHWPARDVRTLERRHHCGALGQFQPGAFAGWQALGPGATGRNEDFHVLFAERFQVQLFFRSFGPFAVIIADMADQRAGLDGDGRVEHHDLVRRLRFHCALQRSELDVLPDPFQFAKFTFTADGDDRAVGQFADFLVVQARFGTHFERIAIRFDAVLAVNQRMQIAGGEVTAQRTVGFAQAGRAQAVFQAAVIALVTDDHLGAAGQEVGDLAGPGAVVHVQAALFRIVGVGIVRRCLDPMHFALGPEPRAREGRIFLILRPILQVHVQAVEDQARRLIGAVRELRRLQAMAHQHEVARKGFLDGQFVGVVSGLRRFAVDAVRHHFAVGQAVHGGLLLQARGGAAIEMHTAVPQAIAAQRVEAGGGVSQMGQLLQRVARVFERVAPVFQGWQLIGFRSRR
ncbi:hypothetical protein D3C76_837270 [compost metagenome]